LSHDHPLRSVLEPSTGYERPERGANVENDQVLLLSEFKWPLTKAATRQGSLVQRARSEDAERTAQGERYDERIDHRSEDACTVFAN
jgi:hypothetical protein